MIKTRIVQLTEEKKSLSYELEITGNTINPKTKYLKLFCNHWFHTVTVPMITEWFYILLFGTKIDPNDL